MGRYGGGKGGGSFTGVCGVVVGKNVMRSWFMGSWSGGKTKIFGKTFSAPSV